LAQASPAWPRGRRSAGRALDLLPGAEVPSTGQPCPMSSDIENGAGAGVTGGRPYRELVIDFLRRLGDRRGVGVVLLCYVLLFLIPVAVLWGAVVPQHWKYDAHSARHYLDSTGVGAATWGWIVIMTLLSSSAYFFGKLFSRLVLRQEVSELTEKYADRMPTFVGFEDSNIEGVFGFVSGSRHWGMRAVKVFLLFARAMTNAGAAVVNFMDLPTRAPAAPLNQAKHIIAWVEFPWIMLLLLSVLLNLVRLGNGNQAVLIPAVENLKKASRFSVLQSLPLAHPVNAFTKFLDIKDHYGQAFAWSFLLSLLFLVPTAVLSVLVKVSQVSFVTESIYWNWEVTDYIQLAGFINNLTALLPEEDSIKTDSLLDYVIVPAADAESDHRLAGDVAAFWLSDLANKLMEQYGLRNGFIMFATLTSQEVGRILKESKVQEAQSNNKKKVPKRMMASVLRSVDERWGRKIPDKSGRADPGDQILPVPRSNRSTPSTLPIKPRSICGFEGGCWTWVC